MAADEPPYLTVGTDVSAKYKGAFCEAKIKKVNRVVKCKVTFKNNQGSLMVPDDQIRGSLRIGALVEARHPEKNQFLEAIINKMQDYSQYTVVFDDGDETTLRRTSLCLKSGRHFAESPTLDQFPLTNPEHFGTPVIGAVKSKRKRRSTYNSSTLDYSSSDEELIPKKCKVPRSRERDPDVGKVVCVDFGDRRKKDNWYPGLVVLANSSQDTFKINTREEYLIRSFKDGKYYQVPKRDTREFSRDVSRRVENNTLKIAVDKALLYYEKGELPPHWDKALHLGTELASDDESHDTETDTSDDEPSEEKDRFVAQLYKFMDERGTPINKAPTVGSKDVNLYKLFKVVHKMGGYNRVTNQNKWKVVYVKMGFQSSNQSGSNQLKLAYKRFLHSFEDFYRKLGCTMVTNSRTTRGRHRSDRNFILTRNTVSPKTKIRGKDKSVEKKSEEKSSNTEKKETKLKSESPKSEEKVRKKLDKPKVEEKEHKPKLKKEDEKPRLARSQSLNKEKRDTVEEKKDTRTDRARAREELKKEKTESPEKKKETRLSAKLDNEREKREKDVPEKKPFEAKDTKDKSPKEKKEEKANKDAKSSKKDDSPQKERKIERPFRERMAKEEKTRNKNESKQADKEKKDKSDDSKEKKNEKSEIEIVKTEVRIFTREKKEKQDLPAKAVKEPQQQPKPVKEVTLHTKTIKEEKESKTSKLKTSNDDEHFTKEKQLERKPQTGESEPDLSSSEIKEEKDDVLEPENISFESRSLPSHDDDDDDLHKEGVKRKRNGDEKEENKSFTDLTDSEEYDDGSGSEKSEKDGKEKQIEIGDRVRVKYGRGRTRKVYEAKVLKIDSSGGEKRYYVHYAGWNMRYDEWVRRSFIVENISDRSKFARQRRQDLFNKGSLSFLKRTDRTKPPGLSSAAKLIRKNSTSSTTSVSSSRTTRSDKNNSLQTSPFSKGLQPKKRARRKSGLSLALTDTSQESESDEEDLLYLYPEGEINDEEELESDSPVKPCDIKKESNSDHEITSDEVDKLDKHSDTAAENSISPLELKIEKVKYEDNEIIKSEPPIEPEEPTDISLKEDTVMKPESSTDNKVSCQSATKVNVLVENASEVTEKDAAKALTVVEKPLDAAENATASEPETPIIVKSEESKDKVVADPSIQMASDMHSSLKSDEDDYTSTMNDTLPMLKKMKQEDEEDKALEVELKNSEAKSIVSEEPSAIVTEIKKTDTDILADSKSAFIASVKEEEEEEKILDEKMPLLTTCVGSGDNVKSDVGILKVEEPIEVKYSSISHEMPTSVPSLLEKEVITNKGDIPQEKNELKVCENFEKSTIFKVLDKTMTVEASGKNTEFLSKPTKSSNSLELQELVKENVFVETTTLLDNIEKEKEEFENAGKKKKKSSCLQVPEPEVGTFVDLSRPCPKLEHVKSEEEVVEAKQPNLPLECSLQSKQLFQTEPKSIPEYEKDDSVELKCDQETKTNISDISDTKDSGLQTSVIAFAGSGISSPNCTSVIASSDSEPFTGTNKEASSVTSDDAEMDEKSSPSHDESIYDELKPMVPEQELTPKKQLYLEEDLPPSDTSFSSSVPENEEKAENLHLSSKNMEDLDDSIHESLTELSIDDASRDRSESDRDKIGLSLSCSVSNVFLNVPGHKSSKDSEELFLPRNLTIDSLTAITKEESDNSEPTNLSMKYPAVSEKFEEKNIFRDSKESISPCGLSFPKKDGKKKKSKMMKQEKKSNLDACEKDEIKTKEGKSKSKKKKSFDPDDLTKFKDSEQKVKTKKLKKNKNKKRFPKREDFDIGDEDKESMSEKIKRKEKRKRDDKKFSKFDLKSDGTSLFKGEASKKERKKGRKNKLGSDKKAELGDKKTKKKKKTHIDDSIDTDSDRESLIGQSEKKKKEKRKKVKPKDTSSSDDTADGKLLIDETKSLENRERTEDPDMSLLCEEKLPASPVNISPDGNTASSSIDDSNNVSPSSDEEHGQAVNLDMYPISSSLDILGSVNHSAEACAVLDNTPPTTPSSTESIPSSSPSHDRESFIHYTESTQSGRDSVDGESDSLQCESNRTEVSESEEYRAAATLAFAVCKSVKEKPRDCTRAPLKRQKSESDDYSPSKRKRKSRQPFGTSDTPTRPVHPRVKGFPRFSKTDNCDAFDSSGASAATVSSPPHSHASTIFTSFSHSSNQQMSASSETSSAGAAKSNKVNFYIPLHEYKDPEKRIAILQEKMAELKKVYASLKAEVATIDRRRKKARKKMREAAGSAANNSSTSHSEDAQNCS